MSGQQLEREMVRKIADAIYPVLIPFEEQDVAIQAENAKQIDAIAYQAWRSFFRGRVGCEQTEADLEAAKATLKELADAVAIEVDAKPGFGGSGYLLARLTDARNLLKSKEPKP